LPKRSRKSPPHGLQPASQPSPGRSSVGAQPSQSVPLPTLLLPSSRLRPSPAVTCRHGRRTCRTARLTCSCTAHPSCSVRCNVVCRSRFILFGFREQVQERLRVRNPTDQLNLLHRVAKDSVLELADGC